MSHSGTLLVLRNLGPVACAVPQRPEIAFLDGAKPNGQPLPVKLAIPGAKFMHPGPVLVPVVVASGAEVTSRLRWVSGEVYDNSVCYTSAAITVVLGGETQRALLAARLCGDRTKGVTFEASPFALDPRP